MLEHIEIDNGLAELLVADFFARALNPDMIRQSIPRPIFDDIIKGFRIKGWRRKPHIWPPFRRLAEKLVEDPGLTLFLAIGLLKHDLVVDPPDALGPRKVEKIAKEAGPMDALWQTIVSTADKDKKSPAAFKKATELALTSPAPAQAEASGPKAVESPSPEDTDAAKFKELIRENRRLSRELRQQQEKFEVESKARKNADQVLSKMRDEYTTGNAELKAEAARVAALQADLDQAGRREADMAKNIAALKGEGDSLTGKARALEADLERTREAIEVEQGKPEPSLTLSLPADLPLMESALSDFFRGWAAKNTLDTERLAALIRTIEQLRALTGLAWSDDPAETGELGPAGSNMEPANVATGQAEAEDNALKTAGSNGRLKEMGPAVLGAIDHHNAVTNVEQYEAMVFAGGRTDRIIIDAHNLILTNKFGENEADGRRRLENLAPVLADRTQAFIQIIFDTKHRGQTVYGSNFQIIFATKEEDGADGRIAEELSIGRDEAVLVVTNDQEVADNADDVSTDQVRAKSVSSDLMGAYLRALERLSAVPR